jgi:hypothetical protein
MHDEAVLFGRCELYFELVVLIRVNVSSAYSSVKIDEACTFRVTAGTEVRS